VRGLPRSASLPPVRCAVHLIDAELATLLRRTELAALDGPHIEYFNLHERAASAVLDDHPVAAGGSMPHLVVMGLGQFGSNVVITAAQHHAAVADGPLRITLVDRHAQARFHALRMQHPALIAAVDATCVDLDFGAPTGAAVDEFETCLQRHPPSLVIVAFDDESLAWSSGLFVRNRISDQRATIVIRTESDGGLAALVDVADGESKQAARIVVFPLVASTCSLDLIDGGVREQLARSLHEGHIARAGSGTGLHRSWTDLSDAERESSRSAADGLIGQLRTIGCEPAPLRRWGETDRVLTGAEIEQIAAVEHGRWKAERESDGWRWGAQRDDTAKLNPLLVEWADLDPVARRQNLVAIAELPASLARAGFEIQRSTDPPRNSEPTSR